MIGQSKYAFKGGVVTITKLDPDDFAPNDADLAQVREEMKRQISQNDPHLTFTISGMRVEIETPIVDELIALEQAVKPLIANERIHR